MCDCGCGFIDGKLGCLCLETKEEFSALFAHWRYSFKPDENGAWKFLLAKELKEVEY